MSELDKPNTIVFQPKSVAKTPGEPIPTRARAYRMVFSQPNADQGERVLDCLMAARMPLAILANAGDFLNERVERFETDAPLQEGWQGGSGKETKGNVIHAWQSRGEMVPLDHQIEGPAILTGSEIVILSRELASTGQTANPTIEVIEGLELTKNVPTMISEENSSHDFELEASPFLKKPA